MLKIASLRSVSIGHLVLNSILYFEKPRSGCVLVVNRKEDISNLAAYEIIKKRYTSRGKVYFSNNILLFYIYKIFCALSRRVRLFKHFIIDIEWIHHKVVFEKNYGTNLRIFDPQAFARKKVFNVSDCYVDQFERWKSNKKIDGKFVCIVARDHGFYSHIENDQTDCRNSDFTKLLPTIQYLIENDYWVIRMGRHHVDDNVNLHSEKYFDYGNSGDIDDVIDMMLIRECDFFIGSNTGLVNGQLLFDTKMLLINWFPIGLCPMFRNCFYLPKRYQKDGRFVSYNSIPKEFLLCEDAEKLKAAGYRVEENDATEIKDFIVNYSRQDSQGGVDPTGFDFVVTGKGSMLSKCWYEKNLNFFSENI